VRKSYTKKLCSPSSVTLLFFLVFGFLNLTSYDSLGIVSKKVCKKAVERNRAKRLMREVFRLNKHRLKPVDIVFIARKGIKGKKFQDVEKDFLKLAKKAGILRDEE